jgi:hypothetical protein
MTYLSQELPSASRRPSKTTHIQDPRCNPNHECQARVLGFGFLGLDFPVVAVRLSFRESPTYAFHWRYDRHPRRDEQILIPGKGVYLVGDRAATNDPNVEAEYSVKRVRDLTGDEEATVGRGDVMFHLPPIRRS